MLTVSNSSSDVKLAYTPTDNIPYFIIHKTLFVIDISKSIASDLISKFKAGTEFVDVTHITFQQYDIYRDIAEYKEGLADFFSYLIFENQAFVNNGINIVAPSDVFLKAAMEQILASQRMITSTKNLFPEVDKTTIDINPIPEELRGGMVITTTSPIITINIAISLSKSYVEVIDKLDPTKDTTTTICTHHTYIQHDIVVFGMSRTIAKFFGSMTTAKDVGTGSMTIDIHKIVKETDTYAPKTGTGTTP